MERGLQRSLVLTYPWTKGLVNVFDLPLVGRLVSSSTLPK